MSAFATYWIVRRWLASSSALGSVWRSISPNARVFGVKLDADDLSMIEAVLARSRDLITLIGLAKLRQILPDVSAEQYANSYPCGFDARAGVVPAPPLHS